MNKKIALLIIALIYTLIVFLPKDFPPAFNADEAAFSYNSYSLLQTGKDEYGAKLPLRLKSFGDYKLPLYSYLSVPLIKVFGLTQNSARLLAKITGLCLVLAIFWLTFELFNKPTVAFIAGLMAAVSPWIHVFANHAHETTLASVLITLALIFLVRFQKKKQILELSFSFLFAVISLYAYHSAKVAFPFILALQLFALFKARPISIKKVSIANWLIAFISLIMLITFAYGELKTPALRVKNLLLFSSPNLNLVTSEAITESRFSPYGLHFFVATREFLNRYLSYFSSDFLIVKGDHNPRFGLENISPLNYLEYLAFFVGLYFLVRKKHPQLLLIGVMFLALPLSGALTWTTYSLSRTFALIILILPLSAYGLYSLVPTKKWLLTLLIISTLSLSLSSLYFLFFHYPKRGLPVRAWQAGYKELGEYISTNYDRYDHFYITPKNGQPYIMLLFYLKYPPQKYQTQATLSDPDEYGFGQVEKFDKFVFQFKTPNNNEKAAFIGYPDDFPEGSVDQKQLKTIKVRTETMFVIYESKKK